MKLEFKANFKGFPEECHAHLGKEWQHLLSLVKQNQILSDLISVEEIGGVSRLSIVDCDWTSFRCIVTNTYTLTFS